MKDVVSTFDWKNFQELHDSGRPLRSLAKDLRISLSSIRRAQKKGLIAFRKQPNGSTRPEVKKRISDSRRLWLSKNRDKHPWRKKSKFTSVPCERLKENLRNNNVSFEEEVCPSTEYNYSVDILLSDSNVIIEVNGNQHYNSDGTLKEYYQKRHNHLVEIGYRVLELHYSLVYNDEVCLNTILNFQSNSKSVHKDSK